MSIDMSKTIVPKSDQLNAEDLLSGPRTVTIKEVRRGSAEQPVDIHLEEFDRPFKPSKTVRRLLVVAWGADAAAYVGRRMTLFRDPAVRFGGAEVGGIRISHMSHLETRLSVALTVTKGRRTPYVVEPLADAPARQPERSAARPDFAALIKAAQSREALRQLFEQAGTTGALTDQLRAQFKARGEQLAPQAAAEPTPAVEPVDDGWPSVADVPPDPEAEGQ